MKTTLCIDTASSRFALALCEAGGTTVSLERAAEQDHSRLLLAAIDELIGGRLERLERVVVVRGPGSYAGLRVGIATAQGLALALGIPVEGVGALEAVASIVAGRVTAVHPGGRGEFGAQDYDGGRPAGPLRTVTAGELEGVATAGEGAGALGGREVGPEARCRAALALALARPLDGTAAVDAIYLREPNITTPRRTAAVTQRSEPASARTTGRPASAPRRAGRKG
ncbi:MAG: tRNA (adenosine(37)-N6)-threonylcarbamoyltransferase complex dimerization subunit type 1 TsaB [Tepidiformaceae bacterium]